jgi:hypothetical protein
MSTKSQAWWFTIVIPATQETLSQRITVKGDSSQKHKTLSKKTKAKGLWARLKW